MMDYMWHTTWIEEVLIALFVICFFWSLGLFLFALMTTVKACMGNYSLVAVATYWLSVAISFLIILFDRETDGMMFFVWTSPVVTVAMVLIERNRKRTLNTQNNETSN